MNSQELRMRHAKKLINHFSKSDKHKSQNPDPQLHHPPLESQANSTTISIAASVSHPSPLNAQDEKPPEPKDLWQAAYDQLDKTQKHVLSTVEVIAQPNSSGNLQTTDILDAVIKTTKGQYEEFQTGGL